MKATVIKFYDEQGNEIKNVSTEIICNGELYVKKEADKQPDYSHLVGMWVKCWQNTLDGHATEKWYSVNDAQGDIVTIENNHKRPVIWSVLYGVVERYFDLTNPKPYNPDTVVGLKELPNDGRIYAKANDTYTIESKEDFGKILLHKGLWYAKTGSDCYHSELSDEHEFPSTVVNKYFSEFHTPAKPIWETCREDMWLYDNNTTIQTNGVNILRTKQDESLRKLTKHLNALAYLSEIARRCNGDRVVDWGNDQQKYSIRRDGNVLAKGWSEAMYREIVFLDEAARDHSFEVDKHIWLDYYGLPND